MPSRHLYRRRSIHGGRAEKALARIYGGTETRTGGSKGRELVGLGKGWVIQTRRRLKNPGLASIGQAIHPFLRILRGMKDRIDANGFGLNAVEDHVRELLDDRSA